MARKQVALVVSGGKLYLNGSNCLKPALVFHHINCPSAIGEAADAIVRGPMRDERSRHLIMSSLITRLHAQSEHLRSLIRLLIVINFSVLLK